MKQAVFVDYTGTLVKEDGPDLHGVVRAICANSDEKDPRRALAFWWHRLKQYEAASFGPAFLTQDEIVQRILADCERQLAPAGRQGRPARGHPPLLGKRAPV